MNRETGIRGVVSSIIILDSRITNNEDRRSQKWL